MSGLDWDHIKSHVLDYVKKCEAPKPKKKLDLRLKLAEPKPIVNQDLQDFPIYGEKKYKGD